MTNPYDSDNPNNEESTGKHAASSGDQSHGTSSDQSSSYGGYGQEDSSSYSQDQTSSYEQNQTSSYDQSAYNQGGYDQSGQASYAQGQSQQYSQYDQQGQYSQQQGFPAYTGGNNQMNTGANKDSFFSALFDMSFTKYVTPSVVKVLYLLLMIVVGLFTLIAVLGTFAGSFSEDGSPILLIIMIPLIIVGAIAYLAIYRIVLEVAVSMIRTSQSVQSIDERQERQLQQGQGGYGQGSGSYYGG